MGRLWLVVAVIATSTSLACGPRPPASATKPATSSATTIDETNVARAEHEHDRPEDRVQGFIAPSAGELSGRVIDADGHPVAHAPVHLVSKHGERTVTTDEQGRFKTEVGEPTMVAVYGGTHVSGSTLTTQRIDGAEAIGVADALPPATLAKPLSDPTVIPDYTDALIDKNAWTRAWLLVEVTDTGLVARVKLLNTPGYDLDAIAVRDAFKLKFEPARDRVNKAVLSQVLWKFEWPAYWWLKDTVGYARRLPANAFDVPCRGSGGTHKMYRDCSPPNLAAAIAAPWIDRPKKK